MDTEESTKISNMQSMMLEQRQLIIEQQRMIEDQEELIQEQDRVLNDISNETNGEEQWSLYVNNELAIMNVSYNKF